MSIKSCLEMTVGIIIIINKRQAVAFLKGQYPLVTKDDFADVTLLSTLNVK